MKDSLAGVLTIVGTGIQAPAHITLETKSYIESAEKLFYLCADPVTTKYVESLNSSAEDLSPLYAPGKPRILTYNAMVESILGEVRNGRKVCVAFYGHPGVFVYPAHQAIRRARSEGYRAMMLPAPSAEDCVFADLGIDPGVGCQTYEATGFLLRRPRYDCHFVLILWQIGVIGDLCYSPDRHGETLGLEVLSERLQEDYGPAHEVIVYEASAYPTTAHRADVVTLKELPSTFISGISTLVVLPIGESAVDEGMVERLKINRDVMDLAKRFPHRPTQNPKRITPVVTQRGTSTLKSSTSK